MTQSSSIVMPVSAVFHCARALSHDQSKQSTCIAKKNACTAVQELVPKGVRALRMFHIQDLVVYKAEKCTVSKTEICLCTLGIQDIPKPDLTHSVSKCYTQHTQVISKPFHCCRMPKSFPSRATGA